MFCNPFPARTSSGRRVLLPGALGLVLAALGSAAPSAQQLNQQGQALLQKGKAAQATRVFRQAYQRMKSTDPFNARLESEILKGMGRSYQKAGQTAPLAKIRARLKELDLPPIPRPGELPPPREKRLFEDEPVLGPDLSGELPAAIDQIQKGQYTEAKQTLDGLRNRPDFDKASWFDQTDILNLLQIAESALRIPDDQRRRTLETLISLYEAQPDLEPKRFAKALRQRAEVEESPHRALEFLNRSMKLHVATPEKNPEEVHLTSTRLEDLYRKTGNDAKLAGHYQALVELSDQFFPGDPLWKAHAFLRSASYRIEVDPRDPEAEGQIQKARELLAEAKSEDPFLIKMKVLGLEQAANLEGSLAREKGDLLQAYALFREAFGHALAQSPPESERAIQFLLEAAFVRQFAGDPAQHVEDLSADLAKLEKVPGVAPLELLRGRRELARSWIDSGRPELATPVLEEARSAFASPDSIFGPEDLAEIRLDLGRSLALPGGCARAEELFEEGRAWFASEGVSARRQVSFLESASAVLMQCDRPKTALEYLELSQSLRRDLSPQPPGASWSELLRAQIYFQSGSIPDAQAIYQRLIETLEANQDPAEFRFLALAYAARAESRQNTDLKAARDDYQKALAVQDRDPNADQRASVEWLLEVSDLSFSLGEEAEAEKAVARALEIAERIRLEGPELGLLLRQKGALAIQRGEYVAARGPLEEARSLPAEKRPSDPDFLQMTERLLANSYSFAGDLAGALEPLARAEALAKKAKSPEAGLMVLERAEILGELNRPEEATQALKEAGELLQKELKTDPGGRLGFHLARGFLKVRTAQEGGTDLVSEYQALFRRLKKDSGLPKSLGRDLAQDFWAYVHLKAKFEFREEAKQVMEEFGG